MTFKNIFFISGILAVSLGAGFGMAKISGKTAQHSDNSHVILLRNDSANPSAIAITKGDYIQFNTADGLVHDIGQGSGDDEVHQDAHLDQHDHPNGAKESGNFGIGQGYRVQFNQVGTFQFHDHLHPKISATVIVYEAGHSRK